MEDQRRLRMSRTSRDGKACGSCPRFASCVETGAGKSGSNPYCCMISLAVACKSKCEGFASCIAPQANGSGFQANMNRNSSALRHGMSRRIDMHRLRYGLASAICWILAFTTLCSAQEKAMGEKPSTTSQEQATRATIDRFNEAFNRHNADALAGLLTEDTVSEDTSPRRTAG